MSISVVAYVTAVLGQLTPATSTAVLTQIVWRSVDA
jgi:hypothetical protein